MIQLFRPSLGEEEALAVREVLASGWLGLGPRTAEFEAAFANHVGARHCVAMNSATAALHLSLLLLNLEPDDEVVLPAITFISTAHAVTHAGGRIVLADVDPDLLTLDPEDAARKISPRTRAVIPVHYGGHPCAMDELHAVAATHEIHVVEDAAHAAGASYRGRPIGQVSALTCFSFQGIKNMTAGEGGAVTTHSDEYAARLRRLRFVGIDRDTWERAGSGRAHEWSYEVAEAGFKYHMHDVSAAIGLVQLRKLEGSNQRRRAIARRYDEAFAELGWLRTPVVRDWARSAQHNYAVRLDQRDELHQHLEEHGIGTSVHYRPLHHHAIYRDVHADVPVAEREWRRLLLLPLYPDLSAEDQNYVIDRVRAFGRARGL